MPYFYIPSHRIRTEFTSLLVCFLIANALNVYAVINYSAPAWELITSILYVLEATVVLYALWVLIRLIVYGFLCLIGRKPKSHHHSHHYRSSHHSFSSH